MKIEAECFKLIRELKEKKKWDWEEVANRINEENGTNISGEQVRDCVRNGVVPFGGWLVKALESVFEIPERSPKSYISFKGGGGNGD